VFGGGGVEQAFGTRAATMAQKATAALAFVFLALSVWLGILYQRAHVAPPPLLEKPATGLPAPAAETSSDAGGGAAPASDPLSSSEAE